MHTQRVDAEVAQRAVVLQLLCDDHDERWTRWQLEEAVSDIASLVVDEALGLLTDAGVAHAEVDVIRASGCARHLDALGLIAV
jgi:hypothetical protein